MGSHGGCPSGLPRNDGHHIWSEAANRGCPSLGALCWVLLHASLTAWPTQKTRMHPELAHTEESTARGRVKTDVLSLFKAVTHENLPHLRHLAFPLATPSARNHKWDGGILGWAPGPCFRDQGGGPAVGRALGSLHP